MRLLPAVVLILLQVWSTTCYAWDSRQLAQSVHIDGLEIAYPEFAIFRLPGTRLNIRSANPLKLMGDNAEATVADLEELVVPAQSGWYDYRLANTGTGEELLLHVYALVPFDQVTGRGYLGNFNIGHYPSQRLRDQSMYDPPAGFIRVEQANRGIRVSPNFTVGQFLSKQSGSYPKYLVLRSALLVKLERILRALNEAGHDVDSFHVMSGYRTPFYNHAIGNVKYSRHLWGGAADIYIDVNPRDGRMDDINGDGVSNKQDAIWLARFIDDMSKAGTFTNLGGVGIYGSNAAHGPFVHVDVRGYRARW